MTWIIVVSVLVGALLLFLLFGFRIVPQMKFKIVERLGKYNKTLEGGLHWIIPLIDRVKLTETKQEKVFDFPEQAVITKDNVTMQIDTVVYLKILDPKLFAYGAENPFFAVESLTATTLRNLVGDLELDETLTSRDTINEKLREILDSATDDWGIRIIRVELKNILPPQEIKEAMEKQMRAEREKREQILIAEGIKQAEITKAQGYKEAKILNAEAKKQALILEAEGKKQSIELINEAKPSKEFIQLQSLIALSEISNGQSNTLMFPTDIAQAVSLGTFFNQGMKLGEKAGDKTPTKKPE
ncbi:SPFH domain-containing protein [Mycoplasma sp. Mirounga ES2805-ORL]|uniref:SPFH domain-containing protein n=1 Tax=Mycoplasma sp. Mirounga ES2805-ORL TaxID=754514 RepID=UPI00197BE92D|nr:SPFH domain-containing protein [Mycoplasma sp. Mirounga ES2805-ORL]QSF13968.1 SPFH/Band 7/PHB domain protein [Mycoplasma sp. Mirounga ES2805-ORL]